MEIRELQQIREVGVSNISLHWRMLNTILIELSNGTVLCMTVGEWRNISHEIGKQLRTQNGNGNGNGNESGSS